MNAKKIVYRVLISILILLNFSSAVEAVEDERIIQSMELLPVMEADVPVVQQIVVIYSDEQGASLKKLGLSKNEIVSGKSLSKHVDVLAVSEEVDQTNLIDKLKANPAVLAVGKNRLIEVKSYPNDPYLGYYYAWQFEAIGEEETWDQVSNENEVVVAVLDTGLNINHPDLSGRVISGYDYVRGTTDMIDPNGHGTMTSGCIAAVTNNGIGIAGAAGTANIKIAPYRIGEDWFSLSNISAALMDAADRSEVRVINMSYGDYNYSDVEAAAISYAVNKGKILVASSGNEGDDWWYAGSYSYPASLPGVISVGATNRNNQIADFSQYNDAVDLCAPGEDVYTTSTTGGYEMVSGTSFASPIVAGAAAVLVAQNSLMTPTELEDRLKETALDLGWTGKDNYYGYGLLQLDEALAADDEIPLSGIELNQSNMTLSQGESRQLSVSYLPENTTDDKSVSWTSMNSAVASVDSDGYVTGEVAGTTYVFAQVLGFSAGCQVTVTEAQTEVVSVVYQTHVQDIGWQDWRKDGQVSGTSGLAKRLEGIRIEIEDGAYDLGVSYATHVQNIGWQLPVDNGVMSGTQGQSLRLEAITISLTGSDAELFDIYYRVHSQNIGWMGWAKNGQQAGTEGFSYRLEAIQIELVEKGGDPPGNTEGAFISNYY